jgi:hypothetical protein
MGAKYCEPLIMNPTQAQTSGAARGLPWVLATLLLVASACGSSSSSGQARTVDPPETSTTSTGQLAKTISDPESSVASTTTTTTTTTTPPPVEVGSVLLTIDDLPPGWTISPEEEEEEEEDSDECDSDQFGISVEADAVVVFMGDEMGPLIGQVVWDLSEEDDLSPDEAIDLMADFAEGCSGTVDKDGQITTYAPLSFDEYGDETLAIKMALESDFFPAAAEVITIRDGDIVTTIAQLGIFAVDPRLTVEVVEIVADRL